MFSLGIIIKFIGSILVILGIIDFGASFMGIDFTSQFVGTSLSKYTPVAFFLIDGLFMSIGKRKDENEKIDIENQNITANEQESVVNSSTNEESIESKLEKLKSMLDKELITEDEFKAKKQKLIDEIN